MSPSSDLLLVRIGGVLALSAVGLGAFGAHALKDTLQRLGKTDVWQTAVRYQMWHALALILVAVLRQQGWGVSDKCGPLFTGGVLLFSGSLYGLSLGGPRWLGPITPIGGTCLLVGWLILLSSAQAPGTMARNIYGKAQ